MNKIVRNYTFGIIAEINLKNNIFECDEEAYQRGTVIGAKSVPTDAIFYD